MFVSWNVRGLSDPTKRFAVYKYFSQYQPAIISLQETHITRDTLQYVTKAWAKFAYHSMHSGYSRGVSILIHNSIPFECIESEIDEEGRYICLHCKMYGLQYVIAAVYVPPPYNCSVFKKIIGFVTRFPAIPAVIMGDFNAIIDPHMDRLRTDVQIGNSEVTQFGRLLREVAFIDLWRSKYPLERQYSCHSSTFQSLSRIDFMLGNSLTRNLVVKVEYLTRGLSDHSPMLLVLLLPGSRRAASPSWKLHPFWLSVIDTRQISDALSEYFSFNCGSTLGHTVWDASKAFLRGSLIHQISKVKTSRRQLEKACRDRVQITEAAYVARHDTDTARDWKQAQEELTAHLLESATNKRFFMKQTFF